MLERAAAAIAGGVGLYDVGTRRLVPMGGGVTAFLGYAAAELSGLDADGLQALVHEDDLPRLQALVRRVAALEDGEGAAETLTLRRADGGWRRVRLSAAVVERDEQRRPAAVMGTLDGWPQSPGAGDTPAAAAHDAADVLAALLEHVPESVTVHAGPPGFEVTAASRRARELFGRDLTRGDESGTATARRTYGLYPPDGRTLASPQDIPPVRAARYGETIDGEEWLIRRPDRSTVAADVHAVPIRDGRTVIGAVCSWREAGDRKQLERALQERAEQLAVVIRRTRAGWWSYEIDSGEMRGSEACARLLAWPADLAMTREAILAAVHADDRAALGRAFDRAVHECAPLDVEFRIPLGDGSERWLSASADCHSDDDGRALRLFGVVTDITAKKRADAALRESEARFRQLAGSGAEILWVLDPVGTRWLYVSPAYERLFGRDGGQADPQAWLRAVEPADRERVAQVFAGEVAGAAFCHDYRVRTPGGVRRVRDRGLVIRDAAGRAVRLLGLTEDITEQAPTGEAASDDAPSARRDEAAPTVDVAHVAQGAAAEMRPLVAGRRLSLVTRLPSEPLRLRGEPDALLRTLAQLIQLAAGCTADGGYVEVDAQARGTVLALGAGGAAERALVNRLLDLEVCPGSGSEPLARLLPALAAVRGLAARHGGSLAVDESGRDRLCRFVLRLPLAAAPLAPAVEGRASEDAQPAAVPEK